jgi:phosphatidate cytidylyltransferase
MFAFTSPSRLGGFAGFLAMTLSAHYGGIHDMVLALVCAIPVTFGLILLQPQGGAPGISVTVLGLTWIGLGFSHAVLLRDLPHGNAIVIDVLVGTFLGDTGAYLGGRAFGRTPMAPRISPNKTLEGLGCGVLLGTVAVWFAGLYQDWLTGAQALLLGLLVALVGPCSSPT